MEHYRIENYPKHDLVLVEVDPEEMATGQRWLL